MIKFLRNLYLRHLFPTVASPHDIVTKNKNGDIFIGGQVLSKEELKTIKNQIDWLKKSDIYRILWDNTLETARRHIFDNSKNIDDLTWGKAMLYNKSIEEEIMNQILKHAPKD